MSQTASLKFSWEFDRDGVDKIKEITDAVERLAAAEASVSEKIEQARNIRKKAAEEAERTVRQARSRAYTTQILSEAGFTTSGLSVRDEAMSRVQRLTYEEKVKAEMDKVMGRQDSSIIGGLSQVPGLGFLAGMRGAGPMAGAMLGGLGVGHIASTMAQIQQGSITPFASAGQINSNFYAGIPIIGGMAAGLARYSQSSAEKHSAAVERETLERHIFDRNTTIFGAYKELGYFPDQRVETGNNLLSRAMNQHYEGNAFTGGKNIHGFDAIAESNRPLVLPGSFARGSVQERFNYREEMQMEGVYRQKSQAVVDVIRSEQKYDEVLSMRSETEYQLRTAVKKRTEEYEKLNKLIASSRNPFGQLEDSADIQTQRRIVTTAEARVSLFENRKVQNLQEELNARKDLLSAQSRVKEFSDGGAGYLRGRLGLYEQRESIAEEQALRLGMAGPAGRAQAQMVKSMVEAHGFDNLPSDLKSTYMQYFPEEGRVKAIDAGKQYAQGFGVEYRDNLDDARKQADELRKAVEEKSRETAAALASELSKAVDQMSNKIVEGVRGAIQAIQAENIQQRIMQNSEFAK